MTSVWTLNSKLVNHSFHIHVNPFQMMRKDSRGRDQVVWRDTLMVKQDEPVEIYSPYEDYIGRFVLHGHILDHEDQGMMQLVEIEPEGGSAHAPHGGAR
ncbi:multicopper oxidase domain-containing protein [Chitinimonas lacunae]|uniref:Multicopper oxidase domain-containing protein n=1 Tax=Chitinimonas lacunae TaxID=1963018 RepID=A0ABV8MP87_9NEIS